MTCEETMQLIQNKWFLSTVFVQLLASFISLVLNILVARRCSQLYFHVNIRILFTAMLYLYVLHSILLMILHSIHLIQYFTYEPCLIGLSPVLCFSLRYPIACCMLSFSALQVSMVVERGIALWKRRHYESYGPKLAVTAIIFSITISLVTILIVTRGITQTNSTSYCILNKIAATESVTVLKLTMLGIDLMNLSGIATLFLLNKVLLRRKSYDLQSSYQLLENSTILRIMLPLSVFQNLFYMFYTVGSAIVSLLHQQLEALTYVTLSSVMYSIPYYTVMSPILIWLATRWSQQLKVTKLKTLTKSHTKENDVYFHSYREAWNSPGIKQ